MRIEGKGLRIHDEGFRVKGVEFRGFELEV